MPSWEQLNTMPDEELQRRFDAAAPMTVIGTDVWADMLVFRATMRAAQAQYEVAEGSRALTAETRSLNAELVTLMDSINKVTGGLWILAFASLVVALAALGVAFLK